MAAQTGVKGWKGRDFLSLHDYSPEEIRVLLQTAQDLKTRLRAGEHCRVLAGKTLGMIFHKASTRTRVSFEVGMFQLGGHALMLRGDELQLRRGETVADTARVLSRMVDGVMIRTFSHDDVVELAEHASVPVINGLTDLLHPCQALTDLLTILEKKGRLQGIKLAYVGDGNNVCHSLLFAAARTGMHLAVATPPGYEPQAQMVRLAKDDARATGARLELGTDPVPAVTGADVVYTDAWASMGQEAEHDKRVKAFQAYQVNAALLAHAREDVIFMHDLPAHRGEEATDEVMDGPHSVVFDQAENRLHAQKAILALLL